MTLTKKTVSTWATAEERDDWRLLDPRAAQMAKMVYEGKTDGDVVIEGVHGTVKWVDQAAADEWTAFITDLANNFSLTVSFETSDNV